MGLMDILQQYTNGATAGNTDAAEEHFEEVALAAPPDALGHGLADAFRSDTTPPFGELVGKMFGQSSPQQQAGLLNQLQHSVSPGILSALAGGILGRTSAPAAGAAPATWTPEQASHLTPELVRELATRAEQHDPTIVDKIGGFYAEHPQLVKTLGSAALAIALAGVANRMHK